MRNSHRESILQELEYLVKILHGNEKLVGIQPVGTARPNVFLGYEQTVSYVLRAHAAGTHRNEIALDVFVAYAVFVE